jgi:hypothetical protein
LASEEMPPHLVMQAWEKHSIQHVLETRFGARIGAIEGEWPLFPTKSDHGAPFLHHCVFFGHKHWTSPFDEGGWRRLSMRVLACRQSQLCYFTNPTGFPWDQALIQP